MRSIKVMATPRRNVQGIGKFTHQIPSLLPSVIPKLQLHKFSTRVALVKSLQLTNFRVRYNNFIIKFKDEKTVRIEWKVYNKDQDKK